jgi:hypothetical protein
LAQVQRCCKCARRRDHRLSHSVAIAAAASPPPPLAATPSGLVFGVQLVSINGATDETATRGSNYYTGDPCNDEARRAGVASGLCDSLPPK